MLLSSLYNKPIIENLSAQNWGSITKIHTKYNIVDYFLTSLDQKMDVHKIVKISDAIMYSHDGRNYPNFNFFAVNNQLIIDQKGKIYGRLVDILLSNNFEIKKLITDSKNLCNVEILSMSESTIVFKRIKKQKAAKKSEQTITNATNPVSIVTTITNYNFLIGRIIQKNILLNDKILFAAGKKITKAEIDTAFKCGKIIDLTLYSKFYNIENL